jgi:hypothetical protein
MEFDRSRLDGFETSGQDLAQAVMKGKRTAILHDDVLKFGTGLALVQPEHFQGHFPKEPFCHRPGKIGKVGLRHLVREGFVSDRSPQSGIEATVKIRQRLDALAGTRGRQSQPQAKRGDAPLSSTKLRVLAAGVEERFRKHPLELIRDQAKVSVIHRGLLSLQRKQHTQEEFLMDRNKNLQ